MGPILKKIHAWMLRNTPKWTLNWQRLWRFSLFWSTFNRLYTYTNHFSLLMRALVCFKRGRFCSYLWYPFLFLKYPVMCHYQISLLWKVLLVEMILWLICLTIFRWFDVSLQWWYHVFLFILSYNYNLQSCCCTSLSKLAFILLFFSVLYNRISDGWLRCLLLV